MERLSKSLDRIAWNRLYSRRKALIIIGALLTGACLGFRRRSSACKPIPFLLTVDVHDRPKLCEILSGCLDTLAENNLKATFFVPSIYSRRREISSVLRVMRDLGHQIGCHGLYHDGRDEYYGERIEIQRKNLSYAKSLLEDAIGSQITSFRAPAFRISSETFQVLEELDFWTDLSVCSQRLPLLSSQIGNYHWLFAPRVPYHPSNVNPYAAGNLKLLEIPVSAFGLPFMSTLSAVSTRFTKLTSTILKLEASLVRKPVVYQCHPEEFVASEHNSRPMKLTWSSLIPNAQHGIPARWAFLETDEHELHLRNEEMSEYFTHQTIFQFLTVGEYYSTLPLGDNQEGLDDLDL
jgi:peptidoglycan/xylan/chitin deacetylase (PgdA/CDA1 family)